MLKYVLLDEIKLQIGWNWVLPVDSSAANFKPNCVQSPILWIQNLSYHDSLHWKINRKSQLDSGIKSQLLTRKNKISSFFSHKLLKCFKQRWNTWRYRKRELQEPRHHVSPLRPNSRSRGIMCHRVDGVAPIRWLHTYWEGVTLPLLSSLKLSSC